MTSGIDYSFLPQTAPEKAGDHNGQNEALLLAQTLATADKSPGDKTVFPTDLNLNEEAFEALRLRVESFRKIIVYNQQLNTGNLALHSERLEIGKMTGQTCTADCEDPSKFDPHALAQSYFELGSQFLEKGNPDLAVLHLEKARSLENSPESSYFLALAHLDNFDLDKAREAFKAYISTGDGKYRTNAEKQVQRIAKLQEFYKAGREMFDREDFRGAYQQFEAGFEQTEHPYFLYSQAMCLASLDSFEQALAMLEQYRLRLPITSSEVPTIEETKRTLTAELRGQKQAQNESEEEKLRKNTKIYEALEAWPPGKVDEPRIFGLGLTAGMGLRSDYVARLYPDSSRRSADDFTIIGADFLVGTRWWSPHHLLNGRRIYVDVDFNIATLIDYYRSRAVAPVTPRGYQVEDSWKYHDHAMGKLGGFFDLGVGIPMPALVNNWPWDLKPFVAVGINDSYLIGDTGKDLRYGDVSKHYRMAVVVGAKAEIPLPAKRWWLEAGAGVLFDIACSGKEVSPYIWVCEEPPRADYGLMFLVDVKRIFPIIPWWVVDKPKQADERPQRNGPLIDVSQ